MFFCFFVGCWEEVVFFFGGGQGFMRYIRVWPSRMMAMGVVLGIVGIAYNDIIYIYMAIYNRYNTIFYMHIS